VTLREVLARKSGFYRDEQDAQLEDLVQLQKGLVDILGIAMDYLLPKSGDRTDISLDEMIDKSGMDEAEFRNMYLSGVDGELFDGILFITLTC
jgi:galactokinase